MSTSSALFRFVETNVQNLNVGEPFPFHNHPATTLTVMAPQQLLLSPTLTVMVPLLHPPTEPSTQGLLLSPSIAPVPRDASLWLHQVPRDQDVIVIVITKSIILLPKLCPQLIYKTSPMADGHTFCIAKTTLPCLFIV